MSFSFGNTGGGGFGAAGTGAFGATGGGFGAAPAAGGAAASPFGGGATGGFGTTSTFGSTGGFGSAIKPAATGFGTGGGFGATTTTGGGMFGSQPAATGAFGAQPTTGTGLFGSGAASPGGGFGAASPTGFGAATTTGGFGAAGGAFGGGATTGGFGAATGTSAFGNNAAASPFGAPKPAAASPFGQTSGFGTTSAFGGGGATGFGTPAPAAGGGGVFGGATGTSAFGAKSPSPFGAATTTTSAFGAPAGGFGNFGASPAAAQQPAQPQVGTGTPPYEVTREQDGTTGMSSFFAISRMAAYAHKSLEELRWEDYVKRTNPAQAQQIAAMNPPQQQQQAVAGGFGAAGAAQPAATGFGTAGGFGATPSAFGTPASTSSGFGSAFGSNATTASTSSFGSFGSQTSTGSGGMFGGTTRSLGFGAATTTQPATSAFGAPAQTGGFGTAATGGFGSTGSSFGSFGTPAAAQPAATTGFGGFGTTTTGTTGGFGAAAGGAFGKPAGTTGGFGFGAATPQPAATTGGFFGQNTQQQQPAGGSLFGGATTTAAPTTGFSFGATAPKPATSTGFGGFGTTATPSAGTGGFGSGGGFGSTGGFGTGGFGAQTSATQPLGGTSLFGGASTGTSGGFGFGTNTTSATGGSSLFGGAPKTGTGMFGSTPTTGTGTSMFGATTTGGGSLFGGAATANKSTSGFNFGASGGLTTTGTGFGTGGFGSFGSGVAAATSTGGFGGGSLFSAAPAATAAVPQPQQPSTLTAAPDVNPYGTGAFGAGLVEQNVKAALDSQSLKPSSSAASRLSTFAQDVGLPRGPLENSIATKRNLLSSNRYSIPVSFIRESGFKGTKSRFATITSASAAAGSGGNALRSSSSTDAVTGTQEDEFKFSSSLFRNSVAKRLVINKTDLRHDLASARHGSSARASVIPLSEDDSASSAAASASRNKVPLKPDDEGYYSLVFRTMATRKSFTLRLKRTDTVKEARDDVRRLLRTTMSRVVSDVQLLSNGRFVNDSTTIEDLNLREGDILDVALVEDLTDVGSAANRDQPLAAKKPSSGVSDSVSKPQPSRFMSYAEFMSSAMREEQEQIVSESHKPVSTACPSMKNEDYYTVPSFDRLKRMTEEELSSVEGFTVGCKGLGSVEWIGRTDVRHLDIDELIHFEKKEVIVYKDDENKHELGTGLNRPAIVELLGIFAPRKVQDPEAYKEKVKQRTRDIGATYIDYTPSTGVWRFRVEHFSRYGFDDDDDDDDEDMDKTADPSTTAGFNGVGDKKKMIAPKRQHPVGPARGLMSSDRVNLVRNSGMYRNQSQFASRSAAVSSFRDRADEYMMEDTEQLNGASSEPNTEDQIVDEDESETSRVIHNVPTSIVFPVAPELLNLQPLGIDSETSLLPHASKSTTYQLYLQVANQSVVAKNEADPGLFLSRSFRCSWGPNGELVNVGRPRTVGSGPAVGRTVTIEFPLEQRSASPLALNKDALALHYECCQSTNDDGDLEATGPVRVFALPSDDGVVQCLRKYAEFADRTRKQYPSSRFHQRTALLWKLVQALWGQEHDVAVLNTSQYCPLAARDDPREVESMETFQMVDLRREAISKWFESALAVEVGHDKLSDASPSEAGVLKLLCQHRIVEAAEMAMECGDFRLSTLIAQAASYEGSDFRTLLADQLSQWSENSTLEYVEEDLVMVYSLLAGSVEVLTSKKAANMSWLMCLALFFWYKRGPATSLKTALTLYRDALAKARANGPTAERAQGGVTKDDVLMEVMKLYVEEAVSLCSVLSPSGFPVESTNGDRNHLDYELSWHLHSVLRAIGFRIERKWESHIHHNYIRQLEGAGLWEEAIYVSLNISDATERASTCRDLLQRNADLLRTAPAAKRVELCDKYALPMEWLDEALAVVAVSKHQYYEEIAHWMAARQYEDAHACLVRHIAPTCLFSGEKSVLMQLLVELEPHAMEISQWTACGANYFVGGGLVLEYLRLEGQQGIAPGEEVDFLDRLMDLAEKLSLARGSSDLETGSSARAQHQRNASELLVARTSLSSMVVALATRVVQLRATLDKLEEDQDDGEQSQASSSTTPLLPFQLQPEFLTTLSGLARGRETKFVESYRATHLLRLCSTFVDWRA